MSLITGLDNAYLGPTRICCQQL